MNMRTLLGPRAMAAALGAAALVVHPAPSIPANLTAVPGLTLQGAWDSNVFNASTGRQSDYVLRAEPTLGLLVGLFGTTYHLQGHMVGEKYARFGELDRVAAVKGATLYPDSPIALTERLRVAPAAYYFDSFDYRPRALPVGVPAESGTLQAGQTDLSAVTRRTREREYSGSLDVRYAQAQTLEARARGWVLWHQYLEEISGVTDFRVFGADASAGHRFSPRLEAGPAFRYEQTDYDQGGTTRLYRGAISARLLIGERHALEGRAGADYSRWGGHSPDNLTAPYGLLGLDSTWQTLHALATLEYGIASGGVVGGPAKRLTARLRAEKAVSARTGVELASALQRDSIGAPLPSQTVTIYSNALTVRYLAARWLTIRAGGNDFRQNSSGPAVGDLRRFFVFLAADVTSHYHLY